MKHLLIRAIVSFPLCFQKQPFQNVLLYISINGNGHIDESLIALVPQRLGLLLENLVQIVQISI